MPNISLAEQVAVEKSEVARHGREGRLPQMSLRRLPVRAARQRPWVLRLGGYPGPRRTLTKETQEFSKTCLAGNTSFMQLQTEENRKRDVGQARPESEKQRATLFLEWANDEVELKRSNPGHIERTQGHRGGASHA